MGWSGGGGGGVTSVVGQTGSVTGSQIAADAALQAAFAASTGEIVLPFPTGNATTDDAAFSAAITSAGNLGVIRGQVSPLGVPLAISTRHVIPNGVDLRGPAGGSTSAPAAMKFQCTTAAAAIAFYGGGGISGGFYIDGNLTGQTIFERQGGTGANGRLFMNITAINNATAPSTYDLALFYGAQNDKWIQCGFANASRDLAVFDQGFGGQSFDRCEFRTAGRYIHRFDNQVAGGVYAVPTDIHFNGDCIIEGNIGTSAVIVNAGSIITYSDQSFYAASTPTGPMIDVVSGYAISFHNPWIQGGASLVAGTRGITVRGTSQVTISGRAVLNNLDIGFQVDGVNSSIDMSAAFLATNVNTNFSGINSGTTAQIAELIYGNRIEVANSTDLVEITEPLARNAYLFTKSAAGVHSWYPGTGFTPDVQFFRRAAGILGVVNGSQTMLATGSGTTAQRPAASPAAIGAIYYNTDIASFQTCTGAAWITLGPTVGTTVPVNNWWPLAKGPLSTLPGAGLNGFEMCFPFRVQQPQTLNALELEVTVAGAAGAVIRFGVRNNNAGIPGGTVLVDAGAIAATSTGVITTGAMGTTPTGYPGQIYWGSVTFQGSPATFPTIRVVTSSDVEIPIYTNSVAANTPYWGYYQTGVTGALPASWTTAGPLQSIPYLFAQEK